MISKRQLLAGLAAIPLSIAANASFTRPQAKAKMSKSLIVTYSRSGNTADLAAVIQRQLACDMVQLEAIPAYPDNYDETVAQVRSENAQGFSPPIKDNIPDLTPYDRIILGSPVWSNQLSLPVKTFLKTYDLSGKSILPFVTYIVSRQGGDCREQVIEMQPNAKVSRLLAVLGVDAAKAEKRVIEWL